MRLIDKMITAVLQTAISHFLWCQEGRAEEEEFQMGNSVRLGKG